MLYDVANECRIFRSFDRAEESLLDMPRRSRKDRKETFDTINLKYMYYTLSVGALSRPKVDRAVSLLCYKVAPTKIAYGPHKSRR